MPFFLSSCDRLVASSRDWYDKAVALDSGFAPAHAMTAFNYAQLANLGLLPAHEAMPQVRAATEKALALDPTLPDEHAMLGLAAAIYDYDWHEAARRFRQAMTGGSVSSHVRRFHALYYLLPVGLVAEATSECRRALSEDPLDLAGLRRCSAPSGRAKRRRDG